MATLVIAAATPETDMSNPDPNHVKGSHPGAAKKAAEGIVWYVINPDGTWSGPHPTRHDAAPAASLAGGTLTRTVAAHGDDAPVAAEAADTQAPA